MEAKSIDEYQGPPRVSAPSPKSGILSSNSSKATGVWIWFLQRIAAVVTFTLLLLHLHAPFSRRLQYSLLAALLLHGVIGIRVMLIDYGKISAKYQKPLFIGLLAAGAVVYALVYYQLW